MGLRDQATQDLQFILNNDESGFGWPISITDPDGTVGALVGNSGDISQLIDPETGQAVSGRFAHISVHISDLTTANLGLPVGIADKTKKPWVVEFNDPLLNSYKFKVSSSNPDFTIGMVTCTLETYDG